MIMRKTYASFMMDHSTAIYRSKKSM